MACAAPLDEPPATDRRERRVVSVLFADLVGFTARSERIDVEDVRDVLEPFQRVLRRELERHGGTVEKFIGDAVMAIFGAPVAHEDDAERAVRAGLAIHGAVAQLNEQGSGPELHVRIAVNTGEVLIAFSANPLAGEGMASGDVVNTAARLQAAAPVNGVLVGQTTYRATDRAIRYEATAPVVAKGKSDPVPVWLAIEARSTVPEQQRGDDVRLVGRNNELSQLLAVLDRSKSEPSTQLVTLVGPPGIGKSRLLRELFSHIEHDPDPVRWRRGRSLPYGEGIVFWAVGEMVKSEAGILESDPADVTAEKLRHSVAAVIEGERDRDWVFRHLHPLVGLDADTAERGQVEGPTAWRHFFEALAEDRTTVAVFEDIHWADDALLDFIDLLTERVGDAPLLIVCTTRPELLERRPTWGGGKGNATTISLTPLSAEATGQFVEELLRDVRLPTVIRQSLSAQADGNPLYAQEYVRMLRDRELLITDGSEWRLADEPGEVPESVHGIIAARLDTLSADERAFVYDAAVVGRTAWVGAVCALSGPRRRRSMTFSTAWSESSCCAGRGAHPYRVRSRSRSRMPWCRTWHTRRSAVRDRAQKHEYAAGWIERSAGDRDDRAELVAYHYMTALRLHREIGDDTDSSVDQARVAVIAAGRQADAVNGYAAAARHYAAGVDLMSSDDPRRPEVVYAQALASFHANTDEAPGLLASAVEALEGAEQWRSAAEASELLGEWIFERGDYDDAEAWFARAEHLAERCGHEYVLGRIAECRATRMINVYRPAEAVALAERGKERAQRANEPEAYALLLRQAGAARVLTGDDRGIGEAAEATNLLVEMGSRYAAWGYIDLCQSLALTGDFNAGRVACDDAMTLGRAVRRDPRRAGRRGAARILRLSRRRLGDGAADLRHLSPRRHPTRSLALPVDTHIDRDRGRCHRRRHGRCARGAGRR